MPRLSDQLSTSPFNSVGSARLKPVLRALVARAELSASSRGRPAEIDRLLQFFDSQYVKPDTLHAYLPEDQKQECPLSDTESVLAGFPVDEDRRLRPLILLGHAGSGKSTLIRYVVQYLAQRFPAFGRQFMYSLVNIPDDLIPLQAFTDLREVRAKVRHDLLFNLRGPVLEHLRRNVAPMLAWINEHARSDWHTRLGDAVINEIRQEGLDNWITRLPSSQYGDLLEQASRYVAKKVLPVVLVIDGADELDTDLQRGIRDIVWELSNDGFTVIVTLRVSTYRQLSLKGIYQRGAELLQEIHSSELLLQKMLERSASQSSRSIPSTNTPQGQTVASFLSTLAGAECSRMLFNIGNGNLHHVFSLIERLPESERCNSPLLLSRAEKGATSAADILEMLLANHKGTFRTEDSRARCGLVNPFCTSGERDPLAYFVRLMALTRLHDGAPGDAVFHSLRDLAADFERIFYGCTRLEPILRRTWWRLVMSGLVNTESCRRYGSALELEAALPIEGLRISIAGEFYLQSLVRQPEFMYLVKDDIEWPHSVTLGPARLTDDVLTKRLAALDACAHLAEIELLMIDRMTEGLDCASTKHGSPVAAYLLGFSPLGQGDRTAFFSLVIGRALEAAALVVGTDPTHEVLRRWHTVAERMSQIDEQLQPS